MGKNKIEYQRKEGKTHSFPATNGKNQKHPEKTRKKKEKARRFIYLMQKRKGKEKTPGKKKKKGKGPRL